MKKIINTSAYNVLTRILLAALALTLTLSGPISIVSAQSLSQIENDTPFYDPSQESSGSCTPTSIGSTVNVNITGNNVKDAFDFFVANGYSATQAAGIVGNLMYESDGTGGDIVSTSEEAGGGGGYGIAQFTGSELTNMKDWVTAQGEDYTSLQGQLDYLLYDLNNSYQTVVTAMKGTSTIPDATQTFEVEYEKPQGSTTSPISGDAAASIGDRISDGQAAYNAYSGDTPSTASPVAQTTTPLSSCGSTTSSSSPDCTTATGNAKILCEAEPYSGIYYEYGGGHEGYTAFIAACPDPTNPPDNQASGGPSIDGGESGNPSPCATDCSALVSIAVDSAFSQIFDWGVSNYVMQGDGSQYWEPIQLNQVQPGDIVTLSEHVEIVDHYDASSGTLYTFGSHDTGSETGEISSPLSYWSDAYRYTGPGSSAT